MVRANVMLSGCRVTRMSFFSPGKYEIRLFYTSKLAITNIIFWSHRLFDYRNMHFELPKEMFLAHRVIVICVAFTNLPEGHFLRKNWPTTLVPASVVTTPSHFDLMTNALIKASYVLVKMKGERNVLRYLQDQMNFAFDLSMGKRNVETRVVLCMAVHLDHLDKTDYAPPYLRTLFKKYIFGVFHCVMDEKVEGELFKRPGKDSKTSYVAHS